MPDATVQDLSRGYSKKENAYQCLLCSEAFEEGVIYEIGGKHFEAFRAVSEHVRAAHGSVFKHLLKTQEKYLGLTQHQADMLTLMHQGLKDREIAQSHYGSANTAAVRNLRFQLREREKQATAYLALMEAFRAESCASAGKGEELIEMHESATMADERFEITEKERAAVLKAYFNADGSLREFPVREKRKVVVLREIAVRFEHGRAYTEKEVNALIGYRDFATIRRYIIEYGFLQRTPDCSEYRVKEN